MKERKLKESFMKYRNIEKRNISISWPGDLDYYGIRDIENLFSNVDDYYKPILVESSFKNNYKYYESRGDKDKKLSVRQYQ